MAVTKLSNSGIKTGVLKYDSMLAGNAAYDPAATWLIQRVAGTGSSTTITFSSIPSTYQHLQLRIMSRTTDNATTDSFSIRLNGDSGSNYAHHSLRGTGSSAVAYGSASQTQINEGINFGATTAANIMAVSIVDIHDYKSTTKNKTVRMFSGRDDNGTLGTLRLSSGLWMNTSVVTSITITSATGNFTTSSTFALYGFKG